MAKPPTAADRRHFAKVAELGCSSRFWAKVDRSLEHGCWPWMSTKSSSKGYGQFWALGKYWQATHMALILAGEAWSEQKPYALHSCDNPSCVNPSHLRWGSPQENMDDRSARGRALTPRGEAHGSAKLRAHDVVAIRCDTRVHREIAAAYGVTGSVISRIKTLKAWRHIQ